MEIINIDDVVKGASETSEELSIKDIIDLIKQITSLAKQKSTIQQQPKPEPMPVKRPEPEVVVKEKIVKEEIDYNAYFDKLIQGLHMALLMYGKSITAEEFVLKLEQDKENIINTIKGGMNANKPEGTNNNETKTTK